MASLVADADLEARSLVRRRSTASCRMRIHRSTGSANVDLQRKRRCGLSSEPGPTGYPDEPSRHRQVHALGARAWSWMPMPSQFRRPRRTGHRGRTRKGRPPSNPTPRRRRLLPDPVTPKPPPCPACGSSKVVPIVFGEPTMETEEAAQRGEVVLGGCLVMGDGSEPKWACRGCGKAFGCVSARR